jgi:phosphomethylpyrimidine synthase
MHKTAWDVRDYAATLNHRKALIAGGATASAGKRVGMAEMSKKLRDVGSEVYVEAEAVKASNKVL